LQSIQVDFRIKNIVKTFSFLFCLVLPFWISRIWLFLTNDDIVINDLVSYVIYLVRFDLKTLAIWYAPLFICICVGLFFQKKWWRFFTQFVFSLLFLFALVFNLVAVLYLPVSKVIVGPELFQLVSGQSPVILWGYILENWYFVILILVVIFLVNKIYHNLSIDITRKAGLVLSFFTFLLIGFFARGGIALKPLNLMDAYAELTSDEVTYAVTPIYFLLESYGKQDIKYKAYFSDDLLRENLSKDAKTYEELPIQNPNICLILLESFGQEYTQLNKSNRPSYTPFLDSLMNQSLNFTNAYANGLRSIDAVASCIAGIPCLSKQPFIGSLYTQSDINTIPKALKK
jgi:glucan phosphoethanolaminetransferase (alkaline phosphatase superfamily)